MFKYCLTQMYLNSHLLFTTFQTYFLLKVGEEEFPCHAALLAASSPLMREKVLHLLARFPDPTVPGLRINATPQATHILLEFIYSGELKLQPDYAFDLFELAVSFQYVLVARMCMAYIIELVYPGCAVVFYHEVQGITSRCNTAESQQLLTILHAWLSFHFTEVIKHSESERELTEKDWLEFLPLSYQRGWDIEDVVSAAVQWYKQEPEKRALPLCCILCCVQDLNGGSQVTSDEESQHPAALMKTISSFVAKWRAEFKINADDMATHWKMFQEKQAYEQNLLLSQKLAEKLSRLQADHGICCQEVQTYTAEKVQQVMRAAQTYQKACSAHKQMMEEMNQMEQQQRLQSQQLTMAKEMLIRREEDQQETEEQLQHNEEVIEQKTEEIKQKLDDFKEQAAELVEKVKKYEDDEEEYKGKQSLLEDRTAQYYQDDLDLDQKLEAHKERELEYMESESDLDQKDIDLEDRKKKQEETEAQLVEKDEALKQYREKLEQEQKELESRNQTLEQKKRQQDEDLKRNQENYQKRFSELERAKEKLMQDKQQVDDVLKKHENQQKEVQKTLQKMSMEYFLDKKNLLERLEKLEKK